MVLVNAATSARITKQHNDEEDLSEFLADYIFQPAFESYGLTRGALSSTEWNSIIRIIKPSHRTVRK